MKTNSSNCVEVLTLGLRMKESNRMQRPPDQSSDRRFQFLTTDDFMFSKEAEVLKIAFGPTCVSLSRAAAEDLSYRLRSFLTYLDHIESALGTDLATESEAETVATIAAAATASSFENVIPLRKNER